MLLKSIRTVVVLVAGAAFGQVVQATATERLADLRAQALQSMVAGSLKTVPIAGVSQSPGGPDARREALLDLFDDAAFIKGTTNWLNTMPGAEGSAAYPAWMQHYRQTLSAGLALLSDDEVEFLLRNFVLKITTLDPQTCLQLAAKEMTPDAVSALLRITPADQIAYARIFKRVYLAALANEVPRREPTESAVTSATLALLAGMPAGDQTRLLASWTEPDDLAGPEQCAVDRIYGAALLAAPGAQGLLLRRDFIVRALRSQLDPPAAPSAVATSVRGEQSGAFQPGAASLEYPSHAARAGIEGKMTVRVWVDETGRAARVKTETRAFNKPSAVLGDGTEIGVDEMFDPVVAVFYKSGRFMQRFKDGKPQAYEVVVPLTWKLQ